MSPSDLLHFPPPFEDGGHKPCMGAGSHPSSCNHSQGSERPQLGWWSHSGKGGHRVVLEEHWERLGEGSGVWGMGNRQECRRGCDGIASMNSKREQQA